MYYILDLLFTLCIYYHRTIRSELLEARGILSEHFCISTSNFLFVCTFKARNAPFIEVYTAVPVQLM